MGISFLFILVFVILLFILLWIVYVKLMGVDFCGRFIIFFFGVNIKILLENRFIFKDFINFFVFLSFFCYFKSFFSYVNFLFLLVDLIFFFLYF